MIDGRAGHRARTGRARSPLHCGRCRERWTRGAERGPFSINVLDPSDTRWCRRSRNRTSCAASSANWSRSSRWQRHRGRRHRRPRCRAGVAVTRPRGRSDAGRHRVDDRSGHHHGTGAGSFEPRMPRAPVAGSPPAGSGVDGGRAGEAPLVAVPDSGTLHDQAPVLIDVPRQRLQPRGDVLVTSAVSVDSANSWLRPSIFQGRWVRVEATQPAPLTDTSGRPGTISYNDQRRHQTHDRADRGHPAPGVAGVGNRRRRRGNGPQATPFRSRCSTTTLDGRRHTPKVEPSSVKVISAGDAPSEPSRPGNVIIRYVPEATGLTAPRVVTTSAAYPRAGRRECPDRSCDRDRQPAADRDHPEPTASGLPVSASVTLGTRLTITIPTFGVDPDGDSVTVGSSARRAARWSEVLAGPCPGPSTIRYEAHLSRAARRSPTTRWSTVSGESRFFIRIGVVPPGDPGAAGGRPGHGHGGAGQEGHRQDPAQRPHRPRRQHQPEVKEPTLLRSRPVVGRHRGQHRPDGRAGTRRADPRTDLWHRQRPFDPSRTSVLVHAILGFQKPTRWPATMSPHGVGQRPRPSSTCWPTTTTSMVPI